MPAIEHPIPLVLFVCHCLVHDQNIAFLVLLTILYLWNIIELQFMELKEKEARMMEKENTLNNTIVQEKELHQSQLIQNGKVIEFNKTEYEQQKI